MARLRQSPLGYRWLAVREDPQAAQAVGINIFRARMMAMLISSSMTAVGGVFYGFYYRNLFPSQVFDISRSIELILAPIIGGLGTVFGPIVGAIILTPLGESLTALVQTPWRQCARRQGDLLWRHPDGDHLAAAQRRMALAGAPSRVSTGQRE